MPRQNRRERFWSTLSALTRRATGRKPVATSGCPGAAFMRDTLRKSQAVHNGVRIPLKMRGGEAANRSGVHSALMDRSPNAAEPGRRERRRRILPCSAPT